MFSSEISKSGMRAGRLLPLSIRVKLMDWIAESTNSAKKFTYYLKEQVTSNME